MLKPRVTQSPREPGSGVEKQKYDINGDRRKYLHCVLKVERSVACRVELFFVEVGIDPLPECHEDAAQACC